MNPDAIRSEIDRKIKRRSPPHEVDYAVFIKPDDPESNCLMKFVRDNNLSVEVFDVSTSVGFLAMDEYSLLECDVPCICSTKDHRLVYDGCPMTIADLRRIEELG